MSNFDSEEQKLYELFDKLNIKYSRLKHEVIKTMEEGKEIMKKLEGIVCVNLLLQDKDGNYYLLIKSLERKLNINEIAKQREINGLKMTPRENMEKILNVPPGCATVFAISKNSSIIILLDKNIPKDIRVNFHPMRNDATVTLSYLDMVKYIEEYKNKIILF